jgi:hypothetical protein
MEDLRKIKQKMSLYRFRAKNLRIENKNLKGILGLIHKKYNHLPGKKIQEIMHLIEKGL